MQIYLPLAVKIVKSYGKEFIIKPISKTSGGMNFMEFKFESYESIENMFQSYKRGFRFIYV